MNDTEEREMEKEILALRDALADIFADMGPDGYLPHIGATRSNAARKALGEFDAFWFDPARG